VLRPQGFGVPCAWSSTNSYALAMREERAASLCSARFSDLAKHAGSSSACSGIHSAAPDGWPGLKRTRYRLAAYRNACGPRSRHRIRSDRRLQIDSEDIYSTDAKIERLPVRTRGRPEIFRATTRCCSTG